MLAVAVVAGRRVPLAGALVGLRRVALLPALSQRTTRSCSFRSPRRSSPPYWLGANGSRRDVTLAFVPCAVLCVLATGPYDEESFTGALFTVAISLVAPIVVGRLLRSRAALNRALREKAALLERRREEAAGRAVVDERTRIAGELHDVVAHALSAMTVQATGARRLALTRPELALRRVRRDRDRGPRGARRAAPPARRPAPRGRRDHARAAALAAPRATRCCAAPRPRACPSHCGSRASERELPAGLDVTAYRVVQDALAAALDVGGAGRAEVRLRFSADHARGPRPRRRAGDAPRDR